MSDITIPADVAKELAEFLMQKGLGRYHHLVLLLDPPSPSLRDEMARQIEPQLLHDEQDTARMVADDILAVVRRHVEALPASSVVDVAGWRNLLNRDEVLRMLGGGE